MVWELAHGQYARALAQLDGAKSTGGSEASRANLRGLARMLNGDARGSLTDFDTALELDPAMAEAKFNRGVARLKMADYAAAAREFDAIANDEKSPFRARAAYHEALALDALHRAADAETWAARAAELDPSLDDALLLRGSLEERRGDLQAAGRSYKQYLERHPQSTVAMLRFAVAAQRAGFAETAKPYLQRVIAAAPDSPEAAEARKFLVMWE